MTVPLIDSHAHLDFDRFDDDRELVLQRACEAGVDTVISIGTNLASSRRALALAEAHDMVYSTAGVHPHQADEFDDDDWPALTQLWNHPKVVGVGEMGLDYYYDYSDRDRQQEIFARQLEAASRLDYPAIIHIRDAFDDAFRLIEDAPPLRKGIVHCFTGGPAECKRALSLGMYISLSGIVTFKNARELRNAVALVPDEKLLVETDSPFLAPVPHRGKRNEPAFVVETAKEVARLRDAAFEDVARVSRENTQRVFGIG